MVSGVPELTLPVLLPAMEFTVLGIMFSTLLLHGSHATLMYLLYYL